MCTAYTVKSWTEKEKQTAERFDKLINTEVINNFLLHPPLPLAGMMVRDSLPVKHKHQSVDAPSESDKVLITDGRFGRLTWEQP